VNRSRLFVGRSSLKDVEVIRRFESLAVAPASVAAQIFADQQFLESGKKDMRKHAAGKSS
jgi:hypothetical protein